MKTDAYTKLMLTIIALSLVWMSLGGPSLMTPAQAQGQPVTNVRVVGWIDNDGSRYGLPLPTRQTP